MSKIREQLIQHEGDLPPGTPDTEHWIVYTQKKTGAPFKWAGSLNAPDKELAVQFAGEHYGLDEACTAILTHHASFAHDGPCGLEPLQPGDAVGDDGPKWCVFGLPRRGGNLTLAGTINAPDVETAILRGTCEHANGKFVQFRVVPEKEILIADGKGTLIWRLHDMNYKFARGYSKDVREKWTRIRDEEKYEDYRKEDIHNHF